MMTEPCKRAAGGNRRQLPPGNEHHRGKQIIAEKKASPLPSRIQHPIPV
jgi:hypothetical protein